MDSQTLFDVADRAENVLSSHDVAAIREAAYRLVIVLAEPPKPKIEKIERVTDNRYLYFKSY